MVVAGDGTVDLRAMHDWMSLLLASIPQFAQDVQYHAIFPEYLLDPLHRMPDVLAPEFYYAKTHHAGYEAVQIDIAHRFFRDLWIVSFNTDRRSSSALPMMSIKSSQDNSV